MVHFIKIYCLYPRRKLLNDVVGHLLCVQRSGSSFFLSESCEGKKPIMFTESILPPSANLLSTSGIESDTRGLIPLLTGKYGLCRSGIHSPLHICVTHSRRVLSEVELAVAVGLGDGDQFNRLNLDSLSPCLASAIAIE